MAASQRRGRGERYASNLSSTSGIVDYSYIQDASGSEIRNGGVNTVRRHPVMQASQIADLLKRKIALLSGGKDKRGGPIISFSAQPSEVSLEDIAACVSYLATIPSEEAREHGYSIITDMRTSTWQSLKALFKVLQESLPNGIHSVYVIKPDAFWESKRASLSLKKEKPQYGFETLMLSNVSKLAKFIDPSELTEDLGGTLPYNHNEWVQNRIDFEKFLKDSEVIQHRFDQANEEVLYRRRDEQLTPEDLLRRQRRLREVVINQPSSVLQLGHALLRRLKEDADSGFRRDANDLTEDQARLKGQLEQVLEELQERQSKLKIYLTDRDRELGVNMDLGDLEVGIKKVVDWIVGPGEKLLASQADIGNSLSAADQLRREHEKLELKCTDTYGNFAELRHVADSMIKQGHPRADDISAQKEFMDTVCRSYASRLEKRRNLLICSVRFHRLTEACFGKMDILLEICVTEITIETVETVENALRELMEQSEAVVFAADDSKEEGHSLLDMLSLPVKNAFGKDITPDYTKQKDHVEELLAELERQKARCDEMAEMRKLKLQQILQLRTCERDADQAIAWLQELLQVMLSQHIDIGRSAAEAENLRKDHNKFEDTARGTYNYGKELLGAALVLRRSLRYDPEPNHEKAQILERAWRRFSQGLSERASRLSVSHMFQRNAERLIDQMDRVCLELASQITSSDPHTSHRLLNAYNPRRNSLLREYGDTVAMGKALLDRMVLPILSPDRTVKSPTSGVPDELQPHVNNISQKLSELEAKKQEMDKIWGLPVSSSGWQRSSSYRSIPDWKDVAHREDRIEPESMTREEGSQIFSGRRVPSSEKLEPRRVASPNGRLPTSNGRMGPEYDQFGPRQDKMSPGPEKMDTSPSRPYGQHPGAMDRSPKRMTSPHDRMSSPHDRVSSSRDRVSSPHDRMSSPHDRMTSPNGRSTSPSSRVAPPYGRAKAHPGAVDEPIRPVAVKQVQYAAPVYRAPPPNGRVSPPPIERINGESSLPQQQREETPEDEAAGKLEEFKALVHEVSLCFYNITVRRSLASQATQTNCYSGLVSYSIILFPSVIYNV